MPGSATSKSPAIEWIATLFMLLAAMPFVALHPPACAAMSGPLLDESQVRLFLVLVAAWASCCWPRGG